METRTMLSWILLGFFLITKTTAQILPGCHGRMDLVVVLDSSESLMEHDPYDKIGFHWNTTKALISRVLGRLPLHTGDTKVGFITYSSVVRPRFALNTYSVDQLDRMQEDIRRMYPERGYTDTAEALRYTGQYMFQTARSGTRNVVLLITDGLSNKGNANTQLQASNLRRLRKVEIYTVAVTPYVDDVELLSMASSPEHYIQIDLNNVAFSVDSVSARLCNSTLVPPTIEPPPCELKMDLALIADNSGSIDVLNFPILQQFLVYLVDQIEIGPQMSRVGLVRFSEFAELEFYLDQYDSREAVNRAIWQMPYDGKATNTAAAIRLVRQQIFNSDRGDRAGIRNVAILITDGQSNVEHEQTLVEADLAKSQGIKFFVVGITNEIDENEVTGIASEPVHHHYFNSTDLRHLDLIREELSRVVCYTDYEYFFAEDGDSGMQTAYSANNRKRRDAPLDGASVSLKPALAILILMVSMCALHSTQ